MSLRRRRIGRVTLSRGRRGSRAVRLEGGDSEIGAEDVEGGAGEAAAGVSGVVVMSLGLQTRRRRKFRGRGRRRTRGLGRTTIEGIREPEKWHEAGFPVEQ